MIIDFDHNPNITHDQKLQSLKESVQMALNEIDGRINSIKSTITNIISRLDAQNDYVVEQGTSGIWTYRKWNSGIAECWGTTASASHAMTAQSGNGYWVAETHSLPSGLFTSIANAQANRDMGQGLVSISIYSRTTTSLSCYVFCTLSTTQTFGISFHVTGRWK